MNQNDIKAIKDISTNIEILYKELIDTHTKIQMFYQVPHIEYYISIINYHSKIIIDIDNKIADLKNELKQLINK